MRKRYSQYLPGVILFVLSLIIGLCIYQDYGISYDEPAQREIGLVSYGYVFEGDKRLLTYIEKDHGVGFELPLVLIEKAMGLKEMRDIFLMRHLVTHIFFLLGILMAYVLVQNLFSQQVISCIAFLFLLLQPRIYAHSFFNSKDIPFLTTTIVALFFAHFAFKRKHLLLFLFLGIACGYATSIRIMAILLAVIFILLFFYDIVIAVLNKKTTGRPIVQLFIFILGYAASLYIAWPTLWTDPIAGFVESYKSLAHFRWDRAVMFNGRMYTGTTLPWTYLPVWFSVTVAPFLWILGLSGIIMATTGFIKNPFRQFSDIIRRNALLYLLVFICPFVSIILLDSVVYDDWRHVYFVYPAFVFIAMYALSRLNRLKIAGLVLAGIQLCFLLFFFIRNHPFQQVYFNVFVPKTEEYLRKSFDYDYWGASHKHAFEYILRSDTSNEIKVCSFYYPASTEWPYAPICNNRDFLPSNDKVRIVLTENIKDADYFISTFRYHPQDHDEYANNIAYSITVQNSTVIRVYKLGNVTP